MILEEFYGEWHLCADELRSINHLRLITLRPSTCYPTSPLLLNHMWRRYSIDLLTRNFSGVLDVTATSLQNTRCWGLGRRSNTKESPPIFKLTHNFRHLYNCITTLRVDSWSMLVATLSILEHDLPSLRTIEVVGKYDFCIYKGHLSYPKNAGTSQNTFWTTETDSWFRTWINFTWHSSHRQLLSLRSRRLSISYQQTFLFEGMNVQKLVSNRP